MAEHETLNDRPATFTGPEAGLTISIPPRHLEARYVTVVELEAIIERSAPLSLLFFGICAGALASFLSVLLTTPIPNPKVFATFVLLTVGFSFGAVAFGLKGWRDYHSCQRMADELKGSKS